MYHHIAGVDFKHCEKRTNCANCSEAQRRKCEREVDADEGKEMVRKATKHTAKDCRANIEVVTPTSAVCKVCGQWYRRSYCYGKEGWQRIMKI